MRILIISPISLVPSTRGSTERILRLALGLHKLNNKVLVLHSGRWKEPNLHSVSYLSFEYFFPAFKRGSLLDRLLAPFNPFLLIKLIVWIRRFKPEILQFEFPIIPFIFQGLLKILLKGRKPIVVLDSHNVDYLAFKEIAPPLNLYIYWIEKFNVKNCDLILATSNKDITSFTQIYGVAGKKLRLIPNGVTLEEYKNLNQRLAQLVLGLNKNDKIIFFHGGYNTPNLEAALTIINHIVPKVKKKIKNVKFLIAGEICPHLKVNKDLMNEVKLLGFVPNAKLFISAADICLAPIFKGWEGSSLKILEYLASGKPVITTPVGARSLNPSDFPNLIICETIEEIISSVCDLLEGKPLKIDYSKIRENISRYDWEIISKKLNEVYHGFAFS